MMDEVYKTNPPLEKEMKENTWRKFLEITRKELLCVNHNLFKLHNVCACTEAESSAPLLSRKVAFIVQMEQL
jgi:hypothetical protein